MNPSESHFRATAKTVPRYHLLKNLPYNPHSPIRTLAPDFMSNTNRVIQVISNNKMNLAVISLQLPQRKRLHFFAVDRFIEDKLVLLIGIKLLRAIEVLSGWSELAILQLELAAVIATLWLGGTI